MAAAWQAPWTYRLFVDSGPVLEKYWAWQAGLGWIGKNGLLLSRHWGNWLVLGEVICDVEIEADEPGQDGCGACTLCMEACPTGAIVAARQITATRCLSYMTVEQRGELTDVALEQIGGRLFGCDACQDVCPYNRAARPRDATPDWPVHDDWRRLTRDEITALDEAGFKKRFAGSCLERVQWQRWQRLAQAVAQRQSR
jgi:epoxyqueuosine reductase